MRSQSTLVVRDRRGPDPCAEAGVPPTTLACAGLYADLATKELSASALAYTPSTPLWSDDAQKPALDRAAARHEDRHHQPQRVDVPVGTRFFKEFRLNGKRVETRMFQKTTSSFWGLRHVRLERRRLERHAQLRRARSRRRRRRDVEHSHERRLQRVPPRRLDRILGFEEVSLGLPGAQGLTLAQLAEKGLVTPAPRA